MSSASDPITNQKIIDALKICFDLDYFQKPSNNSWKSAIFGAGGISLNNTPKPIRVDMLLMLQQSVLKAALHTNPAATIAQKAQAIPLVVEAVKELGSTIGLSLVPNQAAGREMIQWNAPAAIVENEQKSSSDGSGPNVPQNSANTHTDNKNSSATEPKTTNTTGNSDTNDNSNSDSRTVFASPIHFKASETEIVDFFSKYGKVSSVERRKYIERGVVKLRPSVFVMFATAQEAQACAAARPSYGHCESHLGDLFVPRLTVSLKGDPISRDAMADEESKQFRNNSAAVTANTSGGGGSGTDNNNAAAAGGGPSHRKLLTRGLICIARGVPSELPQNDVRSKLGTIQGVAGAGLIDACYIPPSEQNSGSKTKICYVYCTSPSACANLLTCYNRVFQNNEKYAESLGKAVPSLEKCLDAEEEVAMEMYGDAVAHRTQKKMEKNSHNNNSHHRHNQVRRNRGEQQ